VTPNRYRVAAVARALSGVPKGAIDVVETADPQYAAVKKVLRAHSYPAAAALVVANALISYRLTLPGEQYWNEFADFASTRPTPREADDVVRLFEEFLQASRGNRRLVPQKLARLRRAKPVLERLLREPERYRDLSILVRDIASTYSGRGTEKTIVFAAKMLHYLNRAAGVPEEGLYSIPVPIDRRMALLTYTSGLLDDEPSMIMSRRRDEAIEAWRLVAEKSGIPAVSLDAVVWLPAYRIERALERGLDYARDEYARRLVNYTKGLVRWGAARRIAEEILHRDISY